MHKISPRFTKIVENDIPTILGVGGTALSIKDKAIIGMNIRNHQISHPFYIVQNQNQCLLGMDFLDNCQLDFKNSLLTMPDGQAFKLKSPPNQSTLVHLAYPKNVTLVPNSRITLNAKIANKNDSDCMIEEMGNLQDGFPNLRVYPTLSNGKFPVCTIINTSF